MTCGLKILQVIYDIWKWIIICYLNFVNEVKLQMSIYILYVYRKTTYICIYQPPALLKKRKIESEFQSSMTFGVQHVKAFQGAFRKKRISKTSWPADWLVLNPKLVAHLLVILVGKVVIQAAPWLLITIRTAQRIKDSKRGDSGIKNCLNYACRGQPLYDTMMYIWKDHMYNV